MRLAVKIDQLQEGIRISTDDRGRVFDNIFIERLWRRVKCEDIYRKEYNDVRDAQHNIGRYFERYNQKRPHQSINCCTPTEIHCRQGL